MGPIHFIVYRFSSVYADTHRHMDQETLITGLFVLTVGQLSGCGYKTWT